MTPFIKPRAAKRRARQAIGRFSTFDLFTTVNHVVEREVEVEVKVVIQRALSQVRVVVTRSSEVLFAVVTP